MKDCLFCKIIAGGVLAEKVYEDEDVAAFLDVHPVNPGHTLVVPKDHIEQWQDMSEALTQHITGVARKLARIIKEKLEPPRVGLWIEGFEIDHVHVHVCALEKITDLRTKRTQTDMQKIPDKSALADMAAKLRS